MHDSSYLGTFVLVVPQFGECAWDGGRDGSNPKKIYGCRSMKIRFLLLFDEYPEIQASVDRRLCQACVDCRVHNKALASTSIKSSQVAAKECWIGCSFLCNSQPSCDAWMFNATSNECTTAELVDNARQDFVTSAWVISGLRDCSGAFLQVSVRHRLRHVSSRGRSVPNAGYDHASAMTCASQRETECQSERKTDGLAMNARGLTCNWSRPSITERTVGPSFSLTPSLPSRHTHRCKNVITHTTCYGQDALLSSSCCVFPSVKVNDARP